MPESTADSYAVADKESAVKKVDASDGAMWRRVWICSDPII